MRKIAKHQVSTWHRRKRFRAQELHTTQDQTRRVLAATGGASSLSSGTLLGPGRVLFPPAIEARLLGGLIGFAAADDGLVAAALFDPGTAADDAGGGPFFVVVVVVVAGGGGLNTGDTFPLARPTFRGAVPSLFSFSPDPIALRTVRELPAAFVVVVFTSALAAEAASARILPFSRALIVVVVVAVEGLALGFFAFGSGNSTRPFVVVGP